MTAWRRAKKDCSLGWKSNQVDTMGRRNSGIKTCTGGGVQIDPESWGPKARCLGTYLKQAVVATSFPRPPPLPLAILAHLWIFQMCLPFLPLCLSSIGCFLKHPPPFQHCQKQLLLKTFCLLTITYHRCPKHGIQRHSQTLQPTFPAPLLLYHTHTHTFAPFYTWYSTSLLQSPRQKRLPFACVLSPFAFMPSLSCVTKLYTFQFLKLWGHFKQGFCLIHLCVDSAKGGYPSGNVQKVMSDGWMD